MIDISASETPVVVFTAGFAGIHSFVALGATSVSHFEVDGARQANGQAPFVFYLSANDELTYSGPSVQLAGVRLGDELSDE